MTIYTAIAVPNFIPISTSIPLPALSRLSRIRLMHPG